MKILGIHGIGQTFLGPEQLKQHWLSALQDGLSEAMGPRLDAADFDMVAYGALFRPAGTRGEPRIDPEALDDWEREMLAEWWREAAALSSAADATDTADADTPDESPEIQPPDFAGRARTPQVVQRALRQLSKSRFFKALGPERILLSGLRQVRLFLHDAELKRAVLERVAERFSPDTRMVVAHSLGSIVAYEALCAHPEWRVDTLLTLGSPLGIRHLVFEALTPEPRDGRGIWPGVRRWVNIADQGDIVALQKELAPGFGQVEDRLVYNGWRSHDVARYLSAREAGEVIAAALGHG
jgi:hypothetical protein